MPPNVPVVDIIRHLPMSKKSTNFKSVSSNLRNLIIVSCVQFAIWPSQRMQRKNTVEHIFWRVEKKTKSKQPNCGIENGIFPSVNGALDHCKEVWLYRKHKQKKKMTITKRMKPRK